MEIRPMLETPLRRNATSPVTGDDGSSSPRWFEYMRSERGYVGLTVLLDIWAGAWAVLFAQWWTSGPVDDHSLSAWSWIFVPILLVVLAGRAMYKRRVDRTFIDEFEPVQTSVAVSALGTMAVLLVLVPPLRTGDTVVAYVRPGELALRLWLCAAVTVPAVRLARSISQRYLRRSFHFGARTLIIGSGPLVHQLVTRMRQVPDYGLTPVGLLDDHSPADLAAMGVPYLGTTDDLESVVRATGAVKLIIAPSNIPDEKLARTAHLAQNLGMRVRVVPRVMDAVGGDARIEHLGGVPLMVLDRVDPKGWQFAVKHVLGRAVAAILLVLISPVFVALAILVKVSSPGPIFFGQKRIGRDGVVFDCLKFRSMRPPDPAALAFEVRTGAAPGGVEGEDRRTAIGKFMRKTSLDELPQLINVLRGDMSLVGPRPERPEFVDLFAIQVRRYGERHRVKAGITGWAQVHGLRGQTSIADRAEFDNYYIENWSLLLDLKILALTALAVLRSPGE
jgi:exopolysaccharide biosynthesis polyprenyl glycosylphosphotransferase